MRIGMMDDGLSDEGAGACGREGGDGVCLAGGRPRGHRYRPGAGRIAAASGVWYTGRMKTGAIIILAVLAAVLTTPAAPPPGLVESIIPGARTIPTADGGALAHLANGRSVRVAPRAFGRWAVGGMEVAPDGARGWRVPAIGATVRADPDGRAWDFRAPGIDRRTWRTAGSPTWIASEHRTAPALRPGEASGARSGPPTQTGTVTVFPWPPLKSVAATVFPWPLPANAAGPPRGDPPAVRYLTRPGHGAPVAPPTMGARAVRRLTRRPLYE